MGRDTIASMPKYAIVGAGPSGLAAARNLDRYNLDFEGFEMASGVGGLWDINSPMSTVYESAHLISSKTTTEFSEFPMPAHTSDYPGHAELAEYFNSYADQFALRDRFLFNTEVTDVSPAGDLWAVTFKNQEGVVETRTYDGVLIANGTLSEPNVPDIPGEFSGEIFHTSKYKSPRVFADKRVLIVGAGNSGCDIAVDAVHHARSVEMSVRRGYYFVPKYVFGKPADTLNQGKPLPPRIKQFIDKRLLQLFTGDPVKFGFPKPDYKIYESHPVVNSLVLHHLGHGDLRIRKDIKQFNGNTVEFVDGTSGEYDQVVLATGYKLHYPFIDPKHLNWSGDAPSLFLNIFPPNSPNLFVLGMIEASGIGWQGRAEQSELVALFLAAKHYNPEQAESFAQKMRQPWPDLSGGYKYLGLERMSYYVNKDAYRREIKKSVNEFKESR